MGILNSIGRAGKNFYQSGALPEMIRAGLVAAASPTRGAVGTAGDIFGALGAVDEDRQRRQEMARQRQVQQLGLERQAEEDARAEQLNNARVEEYQTRADYNKRRGTQQSAKGVPPTKLQIYKEAFDHYKGQGFSDDDAHVEARSIALGTASPELYNKRTPSSDSAQLNRELDTWRKDPALQEQYPKFEDYYKSIGIGASKADTAGQVTTAKKKAEIPFLIKRPIAGDDQYYDQKITLNPEGTGVDVSYPATGIKTRQSSPGKPPRPRIQVITGDDGKAYRVPVDGGTATPVEGFTPRKVGGGKSDDLKQQLIQSLTGGGASPKPQPKISVGQTVKLKSGQTVTIKKVNPDGTFEY